MSSLSLLLGICLFQFAALPSSVRWKTMMNRLHFEQYCSDWRAVISRLEAVNLQVLQLLHKSHTNWGCSIVTSSVNVTIYKSRSSFCHLLLLKFVFVCDICKVPRNLIVAAVGRPRWEWQRWRDHAVRLSGRIPTSRIFSTGLGYSQHPWYRFRISSVKMRFGFWNLKGYLGVKSKTKNDYYIVVLQILFVMKYWI